MSDTPNDRTRPIDELVREMREVNSLRSTFARLPHIPQPKLEVTYDSDALGLGAGILLAMMVDCMSDHGECWLLTDEPQERRLRYRFWDRDPENGALKIEDPLGMQLGA